jgi:hypothetical protein
MSGRKNRKDWNMKKRIALSIFVAVVVLLVPRTSHARYLNVNTGRFQTMDTFQGNNEDPLSLHKYLYGAGNPVMNADPSGYLFEGVELSEALDTIEAPVDLVAEEYVKRSIATSLLKYTLGSAAALTLFNGGDTMTEPIPQIPDQLQYKQYQSPATGFSQYGQCIQYATSVKLPNPKWFIAYRLKPAYNTEVGGYAPWGNILNRITNTRIAINGFHTGRYSGGLVFDNWYSGVPVVVWPLIYEVIQPPSYSRTVTLMQAQIAGFGEIKLFKDRPPTSRFDGIWNSPTAIGLPSSDL